MLRLGRFMGNSPGWFGEPPGSPLDAADQPGDKRQHFLESRYGAFKTVNALPHGMHLYRQSRRFSATSWRIGCCSGVRQGRQVTDPSAGEGGYITRLGAAVEFKGGGLRIIVWHCRFPSGRLLYGTAPHFGKNLDERALRIAST